MGERGFLVLRSPIGPSQFDFSLPSFEGPEVQQHKREHQVLLYTPKPMAACANDASCTAPTVDEPTPQVDS
jgi:hypothetical protein